MVWGGSRPIAAAGRSRLFADDDFHSRTLDPVWEWRYQPRAGKWALTGNSLRMWGFAPLPEAGFHGVRNVLTQRAARVRRAEVTVELGLHGMTEGQEAGLAHFARTDCRLAVVAAAGKRTLMRLDGNARIDGPAVAGETVWLRSSWGTEGVARFSYSLDGTAYTELGAGCALSWGAYRGDRVGLYTSAIGDESGYADFRHFRYRAE